MTNTTETTSTTQAAAVAEPGAQGAARKPKATRKTTHAKKAATRAKAAKRPATKKKLEAAIPKEFSKKAVVVEMLNAKGGACLAEIAEKTNWLAHTCRGLVSTLGKTHKVVATVDAGIRRYKIVK